MLRKVVLGLLLLVGLALVGRCLGRTGESRVTPTKTGMGLPASTPMATTVNVFDPTPCDDCPDKGQPAATDTPTPALPPAPIPGHPSPDFALPDLAGNKVRLSDLRGKVVLVNFWATW